MFILILNHLHLLINFLVHFVFRLTETRSSTKFLVHALAFLQDSPHSLCMVVVFHYRIDHRDNLLAVYYYATSILAQESFF